MNDLKELQEMNIRRKEEMAAQVMFTNACIMKEIVDDLGNYEEKEVRFYDEIVNPHTTAERLRLSALPPVLLYTERVYG